MRASTTIPRQLQEKVDRELEAGEAVEWIDMPLPRFFTTTTTSAFLFGIPWTLFALFWMWAASDFKIPDFEKGSDLFAFFGLPFVLIGVFMLLSPLWAYRKSFKTVYVITNQRAITFDGGWTTTIRSYPPEKLQEIFRRERPNGTGDVVITRRAWRDSDNDRQSEELGFLRIRNPKEVERMLKTLAEKAVERASRSHLIDRL